MANQILTPSVPTTSSSSSHAFVEPWQVEGYHSTTDYTNSKKNGFTSSSDYYNAKTLGYSTYSDYTAGTTGGFANYADYSAASALGYTTNTDYQNYLSSYGANVDGVNSSESSDIADTSGVDTSYGSNIDLTPVTTGSLTNNASNFSADVTYANNIGKSTSTDEGVITGSVASGLDDTYGGNGAYTLASSGNSHNGSVAYNTETADATATADTTTEDATEDTQMTYAEYLEQIKNNAYQSAKAQQERSIVDANTSYKQNMATYGANAETLASMGLTGSGYSDYINSQAYAQNRSDIQAANATYAQALQDADTSYAANMLDYMNDNNDRYAALLEGANSGTYTASDVESLADTYGLSETQKNALIAAANTYEANKAESDATEHAQNYAYVQTIVTYDMNDTQIEAYGTYYGFSDEQVQALKDYRDELKTTAEAEDTEAEAETAQSNSDAYYAEISASYASGDFESYNPTMLDSYLSSGVITQSTYDQAISDYTSNLYQQIEYALNSGDTTTYDSLCATLDKYYNKGSNNYGITTKDYQAVYAQAYENAISKAVDSITSGTSLSSDNYNAYLDDLKTAYKNGQISQSTYNTLTTQLTDYYNLQQAGVDFSAGISVSSATETDFGKYWDTGKANSEQSNFVNTVLEAAKNGQLENGVMVNFNYGVGKSSDDIYIYYDGVFYKTKYNADSVSILVNMGYTVINDGKSSLYGYTTISSYLSDTTKASDDMYAETGGKTV